MLELGRHILTCTNMQMTSMTDNRIEAEFIILMPLTRLLYVYQQICLLEKKST